jgi:hypothetical protein
LIDRNKQPENPISRELPVHKEFPISTESQAKSNVNQLIFFSDSPFFPIYPDPPNPVLYVKRPMKNHPILILTRDPIPLKPVVKFHHATTCFFARSLISGKAGFFVPANPYMLQVHCQKGK